MVFVHEAFDVGGVSIVNACGKGRSKIATGGDAAEILSCVDGLTQVVFGKFEIVNFQFETPKGIQSRRLVYPVTKLAKGFQGSLKILASTAVLPLLLIKLTY